MLASAAAAGVLDNDFDHEEDSLDAAEVVAGQEPQHGTLMLEGDGSFSYTPDTGFVGIDQFQYTVAAGGVRSLPATVTLRVEQSTCGFRPDLNTDGIVDLADLALLVSEFGSVESSLADVDCDRQVGLLDLIKVQNELSSAAPAPPEAVVAAARRTSAIDDALATSAIHRRTRITASDEQLIATSRRHNEGASSSLIAGRRNARLEARRARTIVVENEPGSQRFD